MENTINKKEMTLKWLHTPLTHQISKKQNQSLKEIIVNISKALSAQIANIKNIPKSHETLSNLKENVPTHHHNKEDFLSSHALKAFKCFNHFLFDFLLFVWCQ